MVKAFTFPGQGAQIVGMARDIYDNFDVAKEVFKEVDSSLNKNLSKIIFEGPLDVLTQTDNAQPSIMCASIALLKVLENESGKSIEELCDFVAGHSLGEYTALCACESLSLADTTKLLNIRGKSFAEAGQKNPGSMCAVLGGSIQLIIELLNKVKESDSSVLQVANDNTVGQIVLSGHESAVDKAVALATSIGFKKAIKLNVSGAFHSDLMESAIDKMQQALENVEINMPKVNFISNATAKITSNPDEIKKNLLKQITLGVRWRETLLLLYNNSVNDFVEVGPGKTLTGFVPRTIEDEGIIVENISNIDTLKAYLRKL